MNLKDAIALLLAYGAPILFFSYSAIFVLLRNRKKSEHILVSLIALCCMLLFAEEYVRHQVSIEYSAMLSTILFSIVLMITALSVHTVLSFTGIHNNMRSRWYYPWIIYLPLTSILLFATSWSSEQQFIEAGIWKQPYDSPVYYAAISIIIFINVILLSVLLTMKAKSTHKQQLALYRLMISGLTCTIIWQIVFGYFNYGSALPPYPFLYSSIVLCYFLRKTILQFDTIQGSDRQFEQLFNLLPEALVVLNTAGEVLHANPRAIHYFNSLNADVHQLFTLLKTEVRKQMVAKQKLQAYETEIIIHQQRRSLFLNADYIQADDTWHILLLIRDITDEKQQQQELQLLAYQDSITRLPNRRYFLERLEDAILDAEHKKETIALLLIDLNQLQWINDKYGHLAGDETLQFIAGLVQKSAGLHGLAARMGGSEFVVYIRNSPTMKDIETIIEFLQYEFARYATRFSSSPIELHIGLSQYPADGTEGQALIHAADYAMFEVKQQLKKQL